MLVKQHAAKLALVAGSAITLSALYLYTYPVVASPSHVSQPVQHDPPPPASPASPPPAPEKPKFNILDSINNATFGFEKIFVISLPSRSDRRDGMVLQAAVSNIEIEFIDGVLGDDVVDKAIPGSRDHGRLPGPVIGCWRGHMDAIQRIVQQNITSALILEDDVDWDVRIRPQLREFALSSQALTQPLADGSGFADPTFPHGGEEVKEMFHDKLPAVVEPKISPYGDSWDALWLGHCGMQFPSVKDQNAIPKGQVLHMDDETVPEKRYMYSLSPPFTLVDKYPQHTRAVHHALEGLCTMGYAVSQNGARHLLSEVALKDVSDAYDFLLRFFCEGAKGRRRSICLAAQPALINHHLRAGPDKASSDIGEHGDGWREHSSTEMIRWSTRLNADALMAQDTVFHDQYPNADV